MESKKTLEKVGVGDTGQISFVAADDAVKRRLLDLGFAVDSTVRCVGVSPLGDPVMLVAGGKVIAVRRRDLGKIYIDLSP